MKISLADEVLAGIVKPELFDIGSYYMPPELHDTYLASAIEKSKRVNADSVYEWMGNNLADQLRLVDLPCIKSPYPMMWIELVADGPELGDRRAILVRDIPMEHKDILPADFYRLAVEDAATDNINEADIKSMTLFELYIADRTRIQGPLAWVLCVLDRHGRALGLGWRLASDIVGQSESSREQEGNWALSVVSPAFWTLGFLHCKNIQAEEVHVEPKVRAKRRKKLGHDPLSMSVLRIDIPGKKWKSNPTGEKTGIEQRFHIVPGHFAHYGDCCPGLHEEHGMLFGKLEGVYWMPSHARGNPERGISNSILNLNVDEHARITEDDGKAFGLEVTG